MEELLLNETKHCSRILCWSIQDLFNLSINNLISNYAKFKTESHGGEDAEVVANEAHYSAPEKDVLPAPGDEAINQDAAIC